MSWSPTGQGMMIDKAYFGGDGSCSSMKWDVSDIKDDMHDIKRQLDDLKTRIVGSQKFCKRQLKYFNIVLMIENSPSFSSDIAK